MKRSPLPRSRKPIPRVNRKRAKQRAAKADEGLRAYVRGLRCLIGTTRYSLCEGHVDVAHVRSRGARGADQGNVIPLCRRHHTMQHDNGIQTFQGIYDLDLKAEAERITAAYLESIA